MNAIIKVFVALGNQRIAETDHKFCLIFDWSLNLLHKSQNLKKSQKDIAPPCTPYCIKHKMNFKV